MTCKNILIVDDDKDISEALREVLTNEGYIIKTAHNGREGLEILKTLESPKVVLLDLMMPIMDGWEFLAIRKMDKTLAQTPVIVFSAADNVALAAGAEAIIKKPVDLETLLKTIRQYCK